MEMIQDTILNFGANLPDWLFYAVLVAVAIAVACFYIFSKQVRATAEKYDIKYETVDGMVKMVASLAIRLYVIKKGVEETAKVSRIKNIAATIDIMYPTDSSIRLSQLVSEVERAVARKFQGAELVQHQTVIEDIRNSIITELVNVGDKIKDNEHDPIINPKQVAHWIDKGVKAVEIANK